MFVFGGIHAPVLVNTLLRKAAIREHGFEDVRQCQSVIEEIDGSISVVPFTSDKEAPAVKEHRLPPLPSHHHRRRGGRRGYRPGQ